MIKLTARQEEILAFIKDYLSETGFPPIPLTGIELSSVQESMERHFIKEALRMAGRNESKAARLLNLNHHTFRYRRKKLQIK